MPFKLAIDVFIDASLLSRSHYRHGWAIACLLKLFYYLLKLGMCPGQIYDLFMLLFYSFLVKKPAQCANQLTDSFTCSCWRLLKAILSSNQALHTRFYELFLLRIRIFWKYNFNPVIISYELPWFDRFINKWFRPIILFTFKLYFILGSEERSWGSGLLILWRIVVVWVNPSFFLLIFEVMVVGEPFSPFNSFLSL